ncbi:hypothetical protein CN154_22770 [Sinorhizobium meliloti]|nr:hypothetical protein CN154_22770 [Sinorhizobium meliloti]
MIEPLIAPIADDHLRAKGAVRHEPCARLVARMFTFWAKKIAYCINRNWRSYLLPIGARQNAGWLAPYRVRGHDIDLICSAWPL